jgi:CubicO group peptidase (beta-lactamase class C family)
MIVLTLAFVMGCAMASEISGDAKIKEILPEYEKYVPAAMEEFQVPGMAIGIVEGDKLVYAKGFGVKEVNGTDPIAPSTIFQIGSTTKAFGAALLATQVDEGKLKWDDKVIDYLPEFRMYDPWVTREFTITDMLSHRSGLPDHFGDLLQILKYNQSHMIRALRYAKPVTGFRSGYAYQNLEYIAAGNLTEKLTDKTWNESINEKIFAPLEMFNSSVDLKSFLRSEDKAFLHRKVNGTVQAIPLDWKYMDWIYRSGPAGAINSNIYDMSRWVIMQMNNGTYKGNQIISENNIKYMQTPKTIVTPGSYYCLGWVYKESKPYPIINHNGGTIGHGSAVYFVPQAKVGIVILSNIFPSAVIPDILAMKFLDMYFSSQSPDYIAMAHKFENLTEQADSGGVKSTQLQSSPPLPLDNYEGDYTNDIFGTLKIKAENGILVTTMGPEKTQIELKPWNRDTFSIFIPDFPEKGGFASFRVGPDGKATSLDIGGVIDSKFEKV